MDSCKFLKPASVCECERPRLLTDAHTHPLQNVGRFRQRNEHYSPHKKIFTQHVYIGHYSEITDIKIRSLVKKYWKI